MINEINFIPVLASLAATAFSAVWFSKIGFGGAWLRIERKPKSKKLFDNKDYFIVFVGHLLSAYILTVLVSLGRTSGFLSGDVLDGVVLAAWGWLGFSAVTNVLSAHIRNHHTDSVIIELGHQLITLIIIGAIIAY